MYSYHPADANSYHSPNPTPNGIANHIIGLAGSGSGDELQEFDGDRGEETYQNDSFQPNTLPFREGLGVGSQ